MRWALSVSLLLPLLIPGAPAITGLGAQHLAGSVSPPDYFRAFQSRDDRERFARAVLRNGLAILVEEQPLLPLAAIVTSVRTGRASASGSPAVELLGELLISGEAGVRTQQLGGHLSVEYRCPWMHFVAVGPAEHMDKLQEAQAELLRTPEPGTPLLPGARFRVEQRRRESWEPGETAARKHLVHLAGQDGVSADPAGEELRRIREVTDEEIGALHASAFHPRNTILTVSGAVLRERFLEKAVALYAGWNPGGGSRETPGVASKASPAPGNGLIYQHLRAPVEEAQVLFAFPVPGPGHEDRDPLRLLAFILARGPGSLLHESLVWEASSALGVDVSVQEEDRPLFVISVRAEPGRVDHVVVTTLAQLEALKGAGESLAGELERARALAFKDFYLGLESLEGRAVQLAEFESLGAFLRRDAVPEALQKVTPAQLDRVLRRYFSPDNLILLEYFPEAAEPRTFTTEGLRETLQLLVPPAVERRRELLGVRQLVKGPTPFSPASFSPRFMKRELKKTSILRGPEIFFHEDHSLPVVHVGLFFPGGRISEEEDRQGVTELLLRTWLNAPEDRTGALIWRQIEFLGGDVFPVNEADFFGLQASVLSPHLNVLLEVLVEVLRQPLLTDEGLTEARRQVLSLQRVSGQNPLARFQHRAERELFGDHPYGRTPFGTPQSIESLTLDDLKEWSDRHIQDVHPVIFLRGDFEGTSFLADLVPLLSHSRLQQRQPFRKTLTKPLDGEDLQNPRVLLAEGPRGLIAFAGPVRGTRDARILDIVECLLMGPGGRLAQALEEKELVLGPDVFHRLGYSGGAVFLAFSAATGRQEKARDEILNVLRELQSAPPTREEFLQVLVASITRYYRNRQSGSWHLREVARNAFSDRPEHYENEYVPALKDVSRQELDSFARRYF